MKYKFLPHTADVKFQAFGSNLEKAFENSALALQEVMTKKQKIKPKIKKVFSVEAPIKDLKGIDYEKMLYSFLEEFLFLFDSEGFILSKIKVKIISGRLNAIAYGDKAKNCKISNDVKAVTYNSMFVRKEKGKWVCQVVLDV